MSVEVISIIRIFSKIVIQSITQTFISEIQFSR